MTATLFVCMIGAFALTQKCILADDPPALPTVFELPINASITAINLLLDDAQLVQHTKQQITIPVILEMNRSIGEGGPIIELIAVGQGVFNRFLGTVDDTSSDVSANVTALFQQAVRVVESHLGDFLSSCDVSKVINEIECVIHGIDDHISDLTAGNQDRYWGLYGQLTDKLVTLHSSTSDTDYSTQLEGILKFGTGNFNRFINDVGYKVERYLAGIADQIRQIILDALKPKCHAHPLPPIEVCDESDSYAEADASADSDDGSYDDSK